MYGYIASDRLLCEVSSLAFCIWLVKLCPTIPKGIVKQFAPGDHVMMAVQSRLPTKYTYAYARMMEHQNVKKDVVTVKKGTL